MKIIVIFCAALLFVGIQAEAQLLRPILSKEVLNDVLSRAAEDLNQPELLAIATANQELETDLGPISIEFDFSNGKSTAWLFVLRDGSDNTTRGFYAAGKVGPLPQVFPIAESALPDIGDILNQIEQPLSGEWMDSDEMVTALQNAADVQELLHADPDAAPSVVGIWHNPLNDAPTWTVFFGDPDSQDGLVCLVQALDGSVSCLDGLGNPTSVADGAVAAAIRVTPQPARDLATVAISEASGTFSELRVFSLEGTMIRRIKASMAGMQEIRLPIGDLTPGVYWLQIATSSGSLQHPLVVSP